MARKNVNRIVLGWIVLIIIAALVGRVSVAAPVGGQTAADFLNIGVGARPAGMGGAYSAIADGALASYWNPAGLTSIQTGEVSLSHFAWYQDVSVEHGSVGFRLSRHAVMAASITFLNYGQITRYDANGYEQGEVDAYDWSGAVSLGMRLSDNIAVGVTGKFINQQLDDISASTFAGDAGVKVDLEWAALAVTVNNLGSDMVFDNVSEKLPTSVRFGIAAWPFDHWLTTSFEAEKRFDGAMIIRNGLELSWDYHYFIRAGLNMYPGDDQRSLSSGLVMGAGIRLAQAGFDYAYTPSDSYSGQDLHRLSVTLGFGY